MGTKSTLHTSDATHHVSLPMMRVRIASGGGMRSSVALVHYGNCRLIIKID
jgi:hypothetical protein